MVSECKQVSEGCEKNVYTHPDDSNLLIKVWHNNSFGFISKKYPVGIRFQRIPKSYGLLYEIAEHLALRDQGVELSFVQKLEGIVDTDLGPAIVVKAVLSKNGELAPPLEEIIEKGEFSQMHQDALDKLCEWVLQTDIIIRDFRATNMLWDEEKKALVVVDGLGSKAPFSLRQMFSCYNMWVNKKRVKKLRRQVIEANAMVSSSQR